MFIRKKDKTILSKEEYFELMIVLRYLERVYNRTLELQCSEDPVDRAQSTSLMIEANRLLSETIESLPEASYTDSK